MVESLSVQQSNNLQPQIQQPENSTQLERNKQNIVDQEAKDKTVKQIFQYESTKNEQSLKHYNSDNNPLIKLTPNDFDFLKILGEGSYGRVVLAQRKSTGVQYAIKVVEKLTLKKVNKGKEALNERNMLSKLKNHPGIIRLFFTFQDQKCLYFVLELAPGGDLFERLRYFGGTFPQRLAQFYTAELVNVLEFLYTKRIAHRDLKPENILLSEDFHIKLVDFATAKDFSNVEIVKYSLKEKIMQMQLEGQGQESDRKKSIFVGTADYVSPEVLEDIEPQLPSDL